MTLAEGLSPRTELLEIPRSMRDALLAHNWPGNIRELENFMRKFVVLRDPVLLTEELRARTQAHARSSSLVVVPRMEESAEADQVASPVLVKVNEAQRKMEAEVILGTLTRTRWNRKQAASLLGVDYKALLYKMKKLGLEDKQESASRASSLSH